MNHKFDKIKGFLDDDEYQSLPKINTFEDIKNNEVDIIDWCKKNPSKDHIFVLKNAIKNDSDKKQEPKLGRCKTYISGSYAIKCFVDHTDGLCDDIKNKNLWDPNDIDLFIVDDDISSRNKVGNYLDIIFKPVDSIEEALLEFDIPVCRVAFSVYGDFYVSIHALFAFLTGKIILPIYLQECTEDIKKFYKRFGGSDESDDGNKLCGYIIDKLKERIDKYTDRGFKILWTETEKCTYWLDRRFLLRNFYY